MSIPLPREGADNNIPDKQYGMPPGQFVEMMREDGVHMNEILDGEMPPYPILPCQSTVRRPREME